MSDIVSDMSIKEAENKVSFRKKAIKIFYMVFITTIIATVTGALLTGLYIIYINVAFNIPQQIADINKGNEILRQQVVDNKEENKEQHIAFVYRDDKTIDKFNVLLKNILEIKTQLKMAIDFKEILEIKKQQGLKIDTTNILIVKNNLK